MYNILFCFFFSKNDLQNRVHITIVKQHIIIGTLYNIYYQPTTV